MAFPDDSPRFGFGIDASGIKLMVPFANEPPAFWYGFDEDGYIIAAPVTELEADFMRFNLARSSARTRTIDWREYRFAIGDEEYAARVDLTTMPTSTEAPNVEVMWMSVASDSTQFYWDGTTLFRSVTEEASL